MQPLSTPARIALDTLGACSAVILVVIVLSGLGDMLDEFDKRVAQSPPNTRYGYTPVKPPDAVERAIARSLAADQAQCEQLHGPHAVALQLPDGSHRCTDKHGRHLARSAVSIPTHRFAQVAP